MKYIRILLFIVCVCVLQIAVLPRVWFLEVVPDLFLISAILLAMKLPQAAQRVSGALACGFLKDMFSSYLFGFNTVIFGVESGIAYFVSRYLYKETKGVAFIVVASVTILNYIFLSAIFRKPYVFIGVEEAVLNCLFLPLVMKGVTLFLCA